MTHEERMAFVTEAVSQFDTFHPTVSVDEIAERIVRKWEQDIQCPHPPFGNNRCAEMSCSNYYGKQ